MGGTGVVLSRVALRAVAGRLGGCLHNTASDHEDSELGRCVYNATGIACLQAQQVRKVKGVQPAATRTLPTCTIGGRGGWG